MGVKILSEKFITPFKPTSTTTWQLGNTGDWLKLSLRCEFSVSKLFSISDSITIADPNTLTLNSGKKWKDLGFDVGFSCTLSYTYKDLTTTGSTPQVNTISFVIESILDNVLTAQNPSLAPITSWSYDYGAIAPIGTGTYEISSVFVYANKPPEGIQLEFGQIENAMASSGSTLSHIDGTATKLKIENTHLLLVGVVTEFDHYLDFKSGTSLRLQKRYKCSKRYSYLSIPTRLQIHL
jgi:hypothetical protein